MTLNVNEIIEKKIQELENNHVIEDAIQKKIASCTITLIRRGIHGTEQD